MIVKAIRDTLAASVKVTRHLAQWPFDGSTYLPAIFTTSQPPASAPAPYLIVTQTGEDADVGELGHRGRLVRLEVLVTTNKLETDRGPRVLANDIFSVLDRLPITPEGHEQATLLVDTPSRELDANGFPGYRLGIIIHARETEEA